MPPLSPRRDFKRSHALLLCFVVLSTALVAVAAVPGHTYGASGIPLHDPRDVDDASWARPILRSLQHYFAQLGRLFRSLPGSPIVVRYVTSSYQNDPFRTLLELLLVGFALRTILQQRTQSQASGSNFVALTPAEIDGLVDEFSPEPLCFPLDDFEEWDMSTVPLIVGPNGPRPTVKTTALEKPKSDVINLASYNFTDLASQPEMKECAIQTLRQFGVGSCSPPGFYGTIGTYPSVFIVLASTLMLIQPQWLIYVTIRE